MKMSYLQGVLLVLLAGTFWSFIPIGIRSFTEADVWQILFYRSIGLLPLVFALIYFQSQRHPIQLIRAAGISGLLGAIGLVAAYAGGIASIRMTSIANAAFLFATAPFFAAVLSRIVLKEPLRKSTVIALFLALVGIAVMVYDNFTQGNWLGDFFALLSAVGFAVFATALRANTSGNSLPVVFIGGVLAIMIAAVMTTRSGSGFAVPVSDIVLALALGAFVLGIGMVLCTLGSRVVPAAELALLCMTEVVLAPVWAWLILSEVPAKSVLIGGGIVIGAIVLNAVSGIRHKPVLAR